MQDDRYMTAVPTASTLTRAELAMIRALEAFSRWVVYLNKAVSTHALSYPDICLLHSIRMRDGAQNLSELMMFLNRKDVSSIQYSLRKLEQFELIRRITGNSKREAGYVLTENGIDITNAFAKLRQDLLIGLIDEINNFEPALSSAADALERMTGIYEHGIQSVLNRNILGSDNA